MTGTIKPPKKPPVNDPGKPGDAPENPEKGDN